MSTSLKSKIALALLAVAALCIGLIVADKSEPSKTESGTKLSIKVVDQLGSPDGKIKSNTLRSFVVDCSEQSDKCQRLSKLTVKDFAPTPKDTLCTAIFGGTQRAFVKGTLNGEPLDAEFSLNNGCEISRWESFSWLIGSHSKI